METCKLNTFLPYKDYCKSAECLDMKRLGKQRVEVLQLLNALLSGENSRWINHPATKMWKGYENALIAYGIWICSEWVARGYKDTCGEKITKLYNPNKHCKNPPWLGDQRLHSSHRSNLLRKDSTWYGKFGWDDSIDLKYFWPVK